MTAPSSRCPGRAEALFAQAVDADIAYMRSAGVIDEEGMSGQAYYDDDDAFEFLLDALKWKGMRNKDEEMLAAFIDEYMELQQRYMEEKGLVEWDWSAYWAHFGAKFCLRFDRILTSVKIRSIFEK